MFCGIHGEAFSQGGYFVYLRDKPLMASPHADFHPKALQRRARAGIPFPSFEDFPVSKEYVAGIRQHVDTVRFALRWLNAVTVKAYPDQVAALEQLPYVTRVVPFQTCTVAACGGEIEEAGLAKKPNPALQKKMDSLFRLQRKRMFLDTLVAAGLTGKGVRIAVFDAGFKGVTKNPAYEPLRARGGIVAARDFYNGGKRPLAHSSHGAAVLGCIAGWYKGQPIGAAPEADFLLARTEYAPREKAKEEDAWMAAAEWADQNGADIISSSLGYTHPLHTYAEMDGRSTVVAKAAIMAIRKGILVINSAGNEGTSQFHYIGTPADVDSVLTIGASYPMISYPMPFSSFGPNFRQVLKPELAGPGYVVSAAKKQGYNIYSGTSFACPMVAGVAACLMQMYPEKSNMEIRQILIESGHRYPYYDYTMGYGVVDTRHFFRPQLQDPEPTFHPEMRNDTLFLVLDEAIVGTDTTAKRNGTPLFFHFAREDGSLSEYRYFRVLPGTKEVGIPPNRRSEGKLRIWFEGYLYEEE